MKRLWLISAVVILLIMFGFIIGCENCPPCDCDCDGEVPEFYISAVVGGTEYVWHLGLTEIEDDAFGTIHTDTPDRTLIFATPYVESGLSEPDNYVWIEFEGTTTGTYSVSDMFDAAYTINTEYWGFTAITLVVTAYGNVGGVITGTFTGTIQVEGGSSTMTVEDGKFNVVRIPDDSFIP